MFFSARLLTLGNQFISFEVTNSLIYICAVHMLEGYACCTQVSQILMGEHISKLMRTPFDSSSKSKALPEKRGHI